MGCGNITKNAVLCNLLYKSGLDLSEKNRIYTQFGIPPEERG